MIRLAHQHPDWTVTRISEEAGVSETRGRALLKSEGLAVATQWRAKRRHGVRVVTSPETVERQPQATDGSPLGFFRSLAASPESATASDPDLVPATIEVAPILAAPEVTPSWDELRKLPGYYDPLDSVRAARFRYTPKQWTAAGILALEAFEHYEYRDRDTWSVSSVPRDPPPAILFAMPPEVAGPLVRLNALFACVEQWTKGRLRAPLVPTDHDELTRAVLGTFCDFREDALARAWRRVDGSRTKSDGSEQDYSESTGDLRAALLELFRAQALYAAASALVRLERERILAHLRGDVSGTNQSPPGSLRIGRGADSSSGGRANGPRGATVSVRPKLAETFSQEASGANPRRGNLELLRDSWVILQAALKVFQGTSAERAVFEVQVEGVEQEIARALSMGDRSASETNREVLSIACRAGALLDLSCLPTALPGG